MNLNFFTNRSQCYLKKSYEDKQVFKKGAIRFKKNGARSKGMELDQIQGCSFKPTAC